MAEHYYDHESDDITSQQSTSSLSSSSSIPGAPSGAPTTTCEPKVHTRAELMLNPQKLPHYGPPFLYSPANLPIPPTVPGAKVHLGSFWEQGTVFPSGRLYNPPPSDKVDTYSSSTSRSGMVFRGVAPAPVTPSEERTPSVSVSFPTTPAKSSHKFQMMLLIKAKIDQLEQQQSSSATRSATIGDLNPDYSRHPIPASK